MNDNRKKILLLFILLSCISIALLYANNKDEIKEKIYDFGSSIRLLSEVTTRPAHKDLFPLNYWDKVGFACATVGLMIAAGGGVGGGGVLVPIYIFLMRFRAKHAIPLSNITVLGGAVANCILNAPKRHPDADRPLVDWDIILIMEPLAVAGALSGAFLNKVLNETVLVIMLVLLLSVTAYSSLSKATKMYRKETLALQKKQSELTVLAKKQGSSSNQKVPLLSYDLELESKNEEEASPELLKILEEERTVPMKNINCLSLMFFIVMLVNVVKGGGAFKSPIGVKCGSTSFWLFNLFMMLVTVFTLVYGRSLLVAKYHEKRRLNYKYVLGDIQWSESNTIIYPLICLTAGLFAGMFGIGGGIVKGPLMLAMNVHPAVASATSATMILLTSLAATTSYIVFGLMITDYSVICFIIGFIATWIGQVVLTYFMKKQSRNSYIAFSIGFIVLLSAFLMTIKSIVNIMDGSGEGGGHICGKG